MKIRSRKNAPRWSCRLCASKVCIFAVLEADQLRGSVARRASSTPMLPVWTVDAARLTGDGRKSDMMVRDVAVR